MPDVAHFNNESHTVDSLQLVSRAFRRRCTPALNWFLRMTFGQQRAQEAFSLSPNPRTTSMQIMHSRSFTARLPKLKPFDEKSEILNSLLNPHSKYIPLRCDGRDSTGGGVSTFIAKYLTAVQINLAEFSPIEKMYCFTLFFSQARFEICTLPNGHERADIVKCLETFATIKGP